MSGMPRTPRAPLRVAAIQAQPTPGDIPANVAAAARLTGRAAKEGARLAVLPELFLPGYHPPTLRADPVRTNIAADPAGGVHDARLDPLRRVATERGIAIVVGAAVGNPDGRRTCSSLVVDRRGGIVSGYDKQHLWGREERDLFSPGTQGATLAVDGWWLGLGICYDACFPEHGRAAVDDGAQGYLCPGGYLRGSQHRRDLYYAARALDNTMYVVFANAVGGDDPWQFNGGSAIYEPEGRPLRRAPDFGEHVIIADFDPGELERTRSEHRMLLDRRGDLGEQRGLWRA
jgi:predicted amidohydrolase